MIKILLIMYFVFLRRSPISICHAMDMNETIYITKNYLGYNVPEPEPNKTKPLHNDKNEVKEELRKLNDLVVPFTWSSFTIYSEKDVRDVKRQFISEGKIKLTSLAYSVNRHLDGKLFIFSVIKDITRDYIAEVDAYFESMVKQRITCQIEEEFYILDFLEKVNKKFATMCSTLLNDLKRQVNGSMLQAFSKTLLHETENYIVNEKSENLNYVCDKLELCKSFPAFSDYAAGLLNEILKLQDGKMIAIVKILVEIIKSKAVFFEYYVISEKVTYLIANKLKSLAENISDARFFLSKGREILSKKFNIFKSDDGEIKRKSKSVRILIDMVDKAYELIGDHYIKFQYLNIIKSIKAWAKDRDNNDVQTTLNSYIDSIENVLTMYWPSEMIQEAKVLSKVMLIENAKIDEKYYYLFTGGSSIEKVLFLNYKYNAEIDY